MHLACVLLARAAKERTNDIGKSGLRGMAQLHQIALTVNGQTVRVHVEPRLNLVDFLRQNLGLTGSHVGCEHGVCGACTVRLDGRIVRGCLILAVQLDGAAVETIEGVSDSGRIADLQNVFHQRNALQCGFCTPGMLLSADELLSNNPQPRRDEIRSFMSGNYCRCTGYQAIVDAVEEVARNRCGSRPMSEHSSLSALERPDSYIGQAVARPNVRRLLEGRGSFIDDMTLPRMVHLAFVRSPHAHAEIIRIDASAAAKSPDVVAIVTANDIAPFCTPWVGVLDHLKGIKSAPQYPLANGRALWQGEPVVAIAAASRAIAEDAAQLVEVEYKELPVVADMEAALASGAPVIHPEFDDYVCFERTLNTGDIDAAFAAAAVVVEDTIHFGRHTGVTLEPRVILADYNAPEKALTLYMSVQCPHVSKNLYAKHLNLDEDKVRVVCKDVGGSFGIKIHTYSDEMAAGAIAMMLRRPVKFVADRLESFSTDIHARHHKVRARLAVSKDGEITAIEMDDLTAIGPYSVYPRTSGIEANQVVNLTGGPYRHRNYRVRARVAFTNLNVACQYRGVGHPIAVAVAEHLVDQAARKLNMDPAEVRQKSFIADDAYPYTSPSGVIYERQSHRQCLRKGSGDDGLSGPAPRTSGVAGEGNISWHWSCRAGRGDESEPRLLRRWRSADRLAGGLHAAPRSDRWYRLCHRRNRTRPGDRGDHRPDRGHGGRRAVGQGQGHDRRHRHHTLRRRNLGLARRRHRWRGRAAVRQGVARQYSQLCRRLVAGKG
jgi:aerobic-type carbon monoxide dehydrogenase small subunit (CoxS/CutS family)